MVDMILKFEADICFTGYLSKLCRRTIE